MKLEITEKIEVELTPDVMAKAFWAMDDTQQADFFEALAKEVLKTKTAYSYGEMQWCYMATELRRRNNEGLQMYNALSVFAFDLFQTMGLQMRAYP